MGKLLSLFCLLCLATVSHAETYKWEDANGIHFTDNLGSVPVKYRQAAAENAFGDITTADPDVARSVEADNNRRLARERKEAAAENARLRREARVAAAAQKKAAEEETKQQLVRDIASRVRQERVVDDMIKESMKPMSY